MLVTVTHTMTPTTKALVAKMPPLDLLTLSITASTPSAAASVQNHP
jgi:hypothetical protein